MRRGKRTEIGTKAPFPGFIEPVLAEQADRVPRGERWIHEIKYDGYRGQIHIVGEAIKVFTRRGHDWTWRFRKIGIEASRGQGPASVL
nr:MULTISPECIES: hypothetical protein [unclassified Bradyrhizobium]